MMTTSFQAAKIPLHFLLLDKISIFEQLQIEEALLRADKRNWCLINTGSPEAIVMGISGKPDLLIEDRVFQMKPVPVIKRFSGGGTVFIDHNTIFVTWICNSRELSIPCCPEKIHQWTIHFYQQAFPNLGMQLRENDYVLNEQKCGGNAQYLCKDRWLHHSSLLWDFDEENMRYLSMPPKMPVYRHRRPHKDFLCKLRDYFPEKGMLSARVRETLGHVFHVSEVELEEIQELLCGGHRQATQLLK